MSIGYIYILSNAAMPGLVKIGLTTRDNVEDRVAELSSATGVPSPFEIEYYCLTKRVEDVEQTLHKEFSAVRVEGKEFFRGNLAELITRADSLVEQDIKPERYCRVTPSGLRQWKCSQCNYSFIAKATVSSCPICKSDSILIAR